MKKSEFVTKYITFTHYNGKFDCIVWGMKPSLQTNQKLYTIDIPVPEELLAEALEGEVVVKEAE